VRITAENIRTLISCVCLAALERKLFDTDEQQSAKALLGIGEEKKRGGGERWCCVLCASLWSSCDRVREQQCPAFLIVRRKSGKGFWAVRADLQQRMNGQKQPPGFFFF